MHPCLFLDFHLLLFHDKAKRTQQENLLISIIINNYNHLLRTSRVSGGTSGDYQTISSEEVSSFCCLFYTDKSTMYSYECDTKSIYCHLTSAVTACAECFFLMSHTMDIFSAPISFLYLGSVFIGATASNHLTLTIINIKKT